MAASLLATGRPRPLPFRGWGCLPGGEYHYSFPWDISADGSVIVGESGSANGGEAFRWTLATGMVGLGDLGGGEFYSYGDPSLGGRLGRGRRQPIADVGIQSRGVSLDGGHRDGGMGYLPGGESSSVASGVSGDGSVVAGVSTSGLSPSFGEAFRWTETTGLVGLGGLPGSGDPVSVPWGISADGEVVVGWALSENGREAFRWTESEGMVGMGDLPGGYFDSSATDVSADGSVIVGSALNPSVTSFRWTAATGMVDLGKPAGALGSEAWGVSADGSVVVGDAALPGNIVPTIWDESHGMRNLVDVLVDLGLGSEMAGWDLEQAIAVSADGTTIVGWGYNPAGDQEAWVAHLGQQSLVEIPTASNATLVLFGALLALAALVALRSR